MSLVDNQWYPKRNARRWHCLITRKLIRDCAYMLLMMFKKSATIIIVMVSIVMVSTVDSDVVVIRVDTFCELKQMQHGVSLWVAFGQGTTITATTMAPYVINLEKKRVFRWQSCMRLPEREIAPAGKHGMHSRSSQTDFNFLGRILSYHYHRRFLFELTEVFTCVLCKTSAKCAELNV